MSVSMSVSMSMSMSVSMSVSDSLGGGRLCVLVVTAQALVHAFPLWEV